MEAPRSAGLNSVCASLLDIHGTEDCREWIHRFGRQPCTPCKRKFGCPFWTHGGHRRPTGSLHWPSPRHRLREKCHHTPESLMNCPAKPATRIAGRNTPHPVAVTAAAGEDDVALIFIAAVHPQRFV